MRKEGRGPVANDLEDAAVIFTSGGRTADGDGFVGGGATGGVFEAVVSCVECCGDDGALGRWER